LLRNPSQASFVNSHGPSPKTYINDAWMKETQRALSANLPFSTVQRRWVHVFINGYYWGVYDMEEHFDADTISAHLLAALPANATNAEKDMYKPKRENDLLVKMLQVTYLQGHERSSGLSFHSS
jgi:creatinine amidohydrolase/Fe(II)-dependent formamide hydrolase-like protein